MSDIGLARGRCAPLDRLLNSRARPAHICLTQVSIRQFQLDRFDAHARECRDALACRIHDLGDRSRLALRGSADRLPVVRQPQAGSAAFSAMGSSSGKTVIGGYTVARPAPTLAGRPRSSSSRFSHIPKPSRTVCPASILAA